MSKNPVYYSKEVLEALKKSFRLSPSTLHKIMNPFCGKCIGTRGKRAKRHEKLGTIFS